MKRAVILMVLLVLGLLAMFGIYDSQHRQVGEEPVDSSYPDTHTATDAVVPPLPPGLPFEYSYPFTWPGPPCMVAAFDQHCDAFLAEQEAMWECRVSETNGWLAGLLRASEMSPSVQDLAKVLASSPPNYDEGSAARIRLLSSLEELKSIFLGVAMPSTDGSPVLHVSVDGHLALLWLAGSNDHLYMFQDTSQGLRLALYYRKP